ncbi:ELYS-like domain-containing protein, partial [Collybia nuda]
QQIERRRADLGDVLIFDILLSSGGIREPDTVFPPSDVESLVRLLDAIESSHYDALKKDCLVYFLLKWHQDGREDRFQVERCIPPQFGSLADAYWHLDTGINIPRAVSILADARLNRDYASRIIYAISLAPDSAPLIVRYIRTAKPLLTEPDDLDIYTLALAESSLREAWLFQRTFNETDPTRSRLLKKTLEWCLSRKFAFSLFRVLSPNECCS